MLVILGNEVSGIDKKILKISDYIIEIPKLGEVKESLNVSICFSIFASYLSFKDKFSKTV
jgi:tRNA G18 (ribose-2'-O)-methylase SpoU